MGNTEFSQQATDTMGIIGAVTISLVLIVVIALFIAYYLKYDKPKNELNMKKTKLEIKELEQKIENNKLKQDFYKAETELMRKKLEK